MINMPKFSIILPTYNGESTLEKALESILEQTFTDYEILVIDGLSNDGTVEIVKAFQEKTEKLFFFSEADQGIYDAMNKGITLSKGVWLYFMGCDDVLFDFTVLEKINVYVEQFNLEVCYGNVDSLHHGRIYDGEFDNKKLISQNICHQAIFFKYSIFKKIGNFDIQFPIWADWHHNIKWFYNDKIERRYFNIVIAKYAAGGYSSLNQDELFLKVKDETLIKYGLSKIPFLDLQKLIKRVLKKCLEKKMFINFLYYGVILFYLKVENKIKS